MFVLTHELSHNVTQYIYHLNGQTLFFRIPLQMSYSVSQSTTKGKFIKQ